MASNTGPSDEESFIILGTSPSPSLEAKCNGVDQPLKMVDLENALNDFSSDASSAFKAHFKLGDGPSTSSMMAASTIVSEDTTTEVLQKRVGEILDENIILKETLKQNNESMKEQFLLIASCQDDMLRTHKIHKEKFDETRELIEKLRTENKKLKQEMSLILAGSSHSSQNSYESAKMNTTQTIDKSNNHAPVVDSESQSANQLGNQSGNQSGPASSISTQSGPKSTIEFVTSPDDDTINKLTAQLELVEKQRRQVIVENEKLTWQKESLEHIVDATSKDRDDLRQKITTIELHHSTKETEYISEINSLKNIIRELEKVQAAAINTASSEEVRKRDVAIQQYEIKVATLQSELKNAQLRVLDLESVKMEFSRQKAGTAETVKMYKDQLQELQNRLKEAQTVMFQPVRFSISQEPETTSPEFANLLSNVKLYDRTLKHIAELLNSITNGTSDNLANTLNAINTLQELKLERATIESARHVLSHVKQQLESQHSTVLSNIGQIKGTLSIFEGIFMDFKELLKMKLSQQEQPRTQSIQAEMDALTAALISRAEELQAARREISELRSKMATDDKGEELEVAKAQFEVYRADFEAEREARQKMASEKENVMMDLRNAQKRNQELLEQLEEVRKLNPNIYKTATTKRAKPQTLNSRPTTVNAGPATSTATTGNMVYTCPKCSSFSSDQYKVMEDHFDYCLDDF